MTERPERTRPEMPPGFAIHNDGPGREVLLDPHDDEKGDVFPTRARAAEIAWLWWDTVYVHDREDPDA